MAFPVTPLTPTVELYLNGAWTDISNYVYVEDGITISRGRQDEQSSVEPSTCHLTLNNRDGRFSPRNPAGAFYGQLGRNTQLRVGVNLGQPRLVIPAFADSATTPDSAGLSITGDIDLRIDLRLPTWGPSNVGGARNLLQKFGSAGQRSYRLLLTSIGTAQIEWSADGTAYTTVNSTVSVPRTTGRQALRATLDVDNGAGGKTVTFYTAPTIAGPWTQLGTPVTSAGTTSIFDSSTAVSISGSGSAVTEVYGVEIRQGIDGTVRANPDFTALADGATSFADGAGNTWSLGGAASITNRRTRFVGEVSSWPVAWDTSGNDVRVAVEAAGILRRVGQGASALRSAFYRAATGATPAGSLQAYWPCEDAEGSTLFASAISGAPAMTIVSGSPTFASDESFEASEPLPVSNNAVLAGYVPAHTDSGKAQVRWLAKIPTGVATDTIIMSVYFLGGTIYRADLLVSATGSLNMHLYDRSLALVSSTGYAAFGALDQERRYSMELTQSGANINFGIVTLAPGASTGNVWSSSAASQTFGTVGSVVFSRGGDMPSTVFGHVMVQNDVTSIFDLSEVLDAYAGEAAGSRVSRLCAEESYGFTDLGLSAASSALGPQARATFLELVSEAADSDYGVLSESRSEAAIAYRPRRAMFSQSAALTLAYGDIDSITPTDDDQLVRNDITVERVGGSSARATLQTGALSVLAPPNGVGRYEEQLSLSLFSDPQTSLHASWRLAHGTVDEPRYPTVHLDLSASAFSSSGSKTSDILDLGLGDLLVITDPPAWLPPDSIRQIVLGYSERIEPFSYEMELNCAPATAWQVGVYDQGSPATRYSATGATLSAGITSTATGAGALSIVTPAGQPLWTSSAGDFPLDIVIGGERITLSAIAATASPQSATVSARSVNGVVKAHLAGAAIQVADSAVYGL